MRLSWALPSACWRANLGSSLAKPGGASEEAMVHDMSPAPSFVVTWVGPEETCQGSKARMVSSAHVSLALTAVSVCWSLQGTESMELYSIAYASSRQ